MSVEWECPVCTLINPSNALICEICSEKRVIEERKAPESSDEKYKPKIKRSAPESSDENYEAKIIYFEKNILKDFSELQKQFSADDIHFENVIHGFIQRRSKELSLVDWFRQFYPSRKDSSLLNETIEEYGYDVATNKLDRFYNRKVKAKNDKIKNYYSNENIKSKLARTQEILDYNELNQLNIFPNGFLNNNMTDNELWQLVISDKIVNDTNKRMIITEFDFQTLESLKLLTKFMNDDKLGEYLKEGCLKGNVKLRYLKQAIDDNFTISSTLEFLKKPCEMCLEDYPIPEMLDLMTCEHSFCKECVIGWLRETIESKYPCKWNCPLCDDTKYQGIDKNMYYNQLKRILDTDINLISIFEMKLLEEQLMKSEYFHWCANEECTNGFEAEAVNKIQCPSCKSFMCVKCNRMWHESHEGKSCKEFELWMLKNDPNLSNLLKNIGIECPNCGMRYALAAGGCLHFDCKPCGVKFCGGCDQLFVDKCKKPGCEMDSFHSHHPRNCLYFLRDYDAITLENMLKGNDYPKLQGKANKKCQFMITNDKLMDVECGKDVYSTTGMCDTHYKEYLVQFVNRYQIDPADFVESKELNQMLFQMVLPKLTQSNQENNDAFKARLKKEVKEKCLFYTPKGLQ